MAEVFGKGPRPAAVGGRDDGVTCIVAKEIADHVGSRPRKAETRHGARGGLVVTTPAGRDEGSESGEGARALHLLARAERALAAHECGAQRGAQRGALC